MGLLADSIGISDVSLKLLICAKESGCRTVAVTGLMSGSEGGEIAHIADLALIAPTSSMERTEDIQLVINHIIKEAVKAHNGL